MMRMENDCVGCETCRNCGRREDYPVWYCDDCGEPTALYHFDEEELCLECVGKRLEKVEESEDI